ncbi:MAG: mechanosensitive ion channel [Urechidicola sp.]|nr:mechanosensitive ion channel [Urechidicola sp.]
MGEISIDEIKEINLEKWMDKFLEFGTEYGLKILGAILLWVIGSWVIKKLKFLSYKTMSKMNYDESLRKFLGNLIGAMLKIFLIIIILGNLGVETTSFAALIASIGLAVGLSLQGSLSNFAGGVLIIIFKPFKIGDYIDAQGEEGIVKHIDILTTKIITLDHKEVIIPNGVLSNGNITNYSSAKYRRVDIVVGVSYNADIKQTKDVFMKILTNHPKVLKEPAPIVVMKELADSSVNYNIRPFVLSADYWDVYFEVMESCKIELDKIGIEIPFPQMDIHKKN